ncbi:hypothetical protein GUJ93_ZPchr0012g20762 [Zizania palustris]|uniref:Uncharacterized protein n=1 Tax=Zizania palustris TaxID=103762 RepID=A0A8J6BWS8_ZIZPA|nr:hypothetical protein GUJ93_ZPchr0012g20762 [Zizania palustris]
MAECLEALNRFDEDTTLLISQLTEQLARKTTNPERLEKDNYIFHEQLNFHTHERLALMEQLKKATSLADQSTTTTEQAFVEKDEALVQVKKLKEELKKYEAATTKWSKLHRRVGAQFVT